MKIIIAQKRYHSNSVGIVRGLLLRGHDVMIIAHTVGVSENHDDLDPLIIPYGKLSSKLFSMLGGEKMRDHYAFPSLAVLWVRIRDFNPDLVILKKGRLSNLIISLFAGLIGAQRILLTNNPPKGMGRSWFKRTMIKIGILPHICVCTTGGLTEVLQGTRIYDLWYRPYPVELPNKPCEKNIVNKLRLLMVGKFNQDRKRLNWLIEAAFKAGLNPKETLITIVGSGQEDSPSVNYLKDLAGRLGWTDSLKLVFNVSHRNMDDIYHQQDIFVMTARDEPFGMVVLEAMAHGLTVVCSDTVGASDCISHGCNGFVYASDDIQELSCLLSDLASSPDLIYRIGCEARLTIKNNFTPEAYAKFFESFVE